MLKRIALLLVLVTGILLPTGCKKSEQSKAPNFFGTPPVVSDVSITKQPRHFQCTNPSIALCCVDPPTCSCCCQPDTVNVITADLDLVKISAKVTDADGSSNLLVVLARFLDPPRDLSPTGTAEEISLEMFDVGTNPVGTVLGQDNSYPVITGDAIQGDGIYTRYFYMKTTTNSQPGDCIFATDQAQSGGTYSQFGTSTPFGATHLRSYEFHVEAVDRAGNIKASPGVVVPITQTDIVSQQIVEACGPPNGLGGCAPPP